MARLGDMVAWETWDCTECKRRVELPGFPVPPCNKCGKPVVTAGSICEGCQDAFVAAHENDGRQESSDG